MIDGKIGKIEDISENDRNDAINQLKDAIENNLALGVHEGVSLEN